MDSGIEKSIQKDIQENKVVLYMKGTPQEPQCGFSAQVINILGQFKIEFKTKNILEDEALRQGIKEYSEWLTIPQLFVNGKFVGGCDIITEMAQNGDLEKLLKD